MELSAEKPPDYDELLRRNRLLEGNLGRIHEKLVETSKLIDGFKRQQAKMNDM